ncbi:hypothetical protein KIN20_036864 [Parelaphostrongylus tenuis]|uniref:Uncharacterized protein n=1 Tax=Parelaphostrongylus tenuis TaxID=148309 RepID=A0AAD5RD57_PARTN|nr:hypothetical protein KIN20_036864 [Parelaphostrongylus tenuis]
MDDLYEWHAYLECFVPYRGEKFAYSTVQMTNNRATSSRPKTKNVAYLTLFMTLEENSYLCDKKAKHQKRTPIDYIICGDVVAKKAAEKDLMCNGYLHKCTKILNELLTSSQPSIIVPPKILTLM